jgi:hypothetical protein
MSLTADPYLFESEPIHDAVPLTTPRSTDQSTTTTRFWATLSLCPATVRQPSTGTVPLSGP